MKNFISVKDALDPNQLASRAIEIKKNPYGSASIGRNKVLGLIFFNSSLRTRMSTTRAAYNLGMQVMTLNVSSDLWQLEMEDGAVMNQGNAEHVKEAIPVMSSYCDVLAVRSFPSLIDREKDYREELIGSFVRLVHCPIINLESATLHPLQSLTDLMTIREHQVIEKPKVVLTWAPHVKPLPQSVANSFAQWMVAANVNLTITHPEKMNLDTQFSDGATVETDQEYALQNADFVYVKNWSSYNDYGKMIDAPNWMMTKAKLNLTNSAKLMHCLPVRRNVVIADDAMDSDQSAIQELAANRLWAAQAVLTEILRDL
ncbi:MAG: acetylornithine carbamoyltransferase [Cyclobacteriaceae bacterium]